MVERSSPQLKRTLRILTNLVVMFKFTDEQPHGLHKQTSYSITWYHKPSHCIVFPIFHPSSFFSFFFLPDPADAMICNLTLFRSHPPNTIVKKTKKRITTRIWRDILTSKTREVSLKFAPTLQQQRTQILETHTRRLKAKRTAQHLDHA